MAFIQSYNLKGTYFSAKDICHDITGFFWCIHSIPIVPVEEIPRFFNMLKMLEVS